MKYLSGDEMLYVKRIVFLLVVLSISNVLPINAYQKQKPKTDASWAETTLASLNLDEKIGQLIIPATVGMFMSQDSETFQQVRRDINEFHVGGYHMLGEINILHEPAGVSLLINHMQEMSKLPLWITADFEGGVGIRYIGATRLPRAMAIGATANPELLRLPRDLLERQAQDLQLRQSPPLAASGSRRCSECRRRLQSQPLSTAAISTSP